MRNPHNQCQPRTEQQLRRRSTFTAVVERRRIPFPTFIQFFHRAIDKRMTHQNAVFTRPRSSRIQSIQSIQESIEGGTYNPNHTTDSGRREGMNRVSILSREFHCVLIFHPTHFAVSFSLSILYRLVYGSPCNTPMPASANNQHHPFRSTHTCVQETLHSLPNPFQNEEMEWVLHRLQPEES